MHIHQKFSFYNDLSYSYFTHVYVCVFPCVCGCPQRPEDGIGPFELELKALDVGAGN